MSICLCIMLGVQFFVDIILPGDVVYKVEVTFYDNTHLICFVRNAKKPSNADIRKTKDGRTLYHFYDFKCDEKNLYNVVDVKILGIDK